MLGAHKELKATRISGRNTGGQSATRIGGEAKGECPTHKRTVFFTRGGFETVIWIGAGGNDAWGENLEFHGVDLRPLFGAPSW
jgi:hypothetical protein